MAFASTASVPTLPRDGAVDGTAGQEPVLAASLVSEATGGPTL